MYWFGAKRFLSEFQCQDPYFVSISCTNFATRRWTVATQHQTNTSVQKCRFKWCSKTTWPSPRFFLTSSSCSSTRWSPNCKHTDTSQTPTFPDLDPETLLFGYRRISLKLRIVVASVVMVLLFGVSMALTRISTDDCEQTLVSAGRWHWLINPQCMSCLCFTGQMVFFAVTMVTIVIMNGINLSAVN